MRHCWPPPLHSRLLSTEGSEAELVILADCCRVGDCQLWYCAGWYLSGCFVESSCSFRTAFTRFFHHQPHISAPHALSTCHCSFHWYASACLTSFVCSIADLPCHTRYDDVAGREASAASQVQSHPHGDRLLPSPATTAERQPYNERQREPASKLSFCQPLVPLAAVRRPQHTTIATADVAGARAADRGVALLDAAQPAT